MAASDLNHTPATMIFYIYILSTCGSVLSIEGGFFGYPMFRIDPNKSPPAQPLRDCDVTLKQTEDICTGPEWSCKDRCGFGLKDKNSSQPVACYCDSDCTLYRSCCEDFQQMCPSEQKQSVYPDRLEANCVDHIGAKLIRGCPPGYRNSRIIIGCGLLPLSVADFINIVPVTDSNTGLHFSNWFCWECWKESSLGLGKPVSWSLTAVLPSDILGDIQYSQKFMLDYIIHNPEKQFWKSPIPAHHCHDEVYTRECSSCTNEYWASNKCFEYLESFVEVGSKKYPSRYCYLCSDDFLNARASGQEIACKVPNTDPRVPVPSSKEFTVKVSLDEGNLRAELTHPEQQSTYSWESVICNQDSPWCEAVTCKNGLQPEAGRCNDIYKRGVMQVQLCLEARSVIEAASQSCTKNLSFVDSSLMADFVRPLTESCLNMVHIDDDFKILEMRPVNRSNVYELQIDYVLNKEAPNGHGDVNLRNCMLLAVSRFTQSARSGTLNTASLNRDETQVDTHKDGRDEPKPKASRLNYVPRTHWKIDAPWLSTPATNSEESQQTKNGTTEEWGNSALQDFICIISFRGTRTLNRMISMTDENCYISYIFTDV